jgi:hypothetical protein
MDKRRPRTRGRESEGRRQRCQRTRWHRGRKLCLRNSDLRPPRAGCGVGHVPAIPDRMGGAAACTHADAQPGRDGAGTGRRRSTHWGGRGSRFCVSKRRDRVLAGTPEAGGRGGVEGGPPAGCRRVRPGAAAYSRQQPPAHMPRRGHGGPSPAGTRPAGPFETKVPRRASVKMDERRLREGTSAEGRRINRRRGGAGGRKSRRTRIRSCATRR